MQSFQCTNPGCIYNVFTFSLNVIHGSYDEVTCPNCGAQAKYLGSDELTSNGESSNAANIDRPPDRPDDLSRIYSFD